MRAIVAAVDASGRPAEFVVIRVGNDIRVLDARCTHRGCIVAVDGAELLCRCHYSIFDGATGARLAGPAPRGLREVRSEVVDGVVLAYD